MPAAQRGLQYQPVECLWFGATVKCLMYISKSMPRALYRPFGYFTYNMDPNLPAPMIPTWIGLPDSSSWASFVDKLVILN